MRYTETSTRSKRELLFSRTYRVYTFSKEKVPETGMCEKSIVIIMDILKRREWWSICLWLLHIEHHVRQGRHFGQFDRFLYWRQYLMIMVIKYMVAARSESIFALVYNMLSGINSLLGW